jgi:hypothetical protein
MGKFNFDVKSNKVVLTRKTADAQNRKTAEKPDETPVSEPVDKPRGGKGAEKQ